MTNRTDHPRGELALVFRRAEQIIAGRGHSKGKLTQPDGSVCAVGALRIAAGFDPDNELGLLPYQAAEFLSQQVWCKSGNADAVERVADWNDDPETTSVMVCEALLAAAKAIEEQEARAVVPVCLRTADGAVFELASVPAHGDPRYVLAGCQGAPPSVFAELHELVDGFGAVPAGGAS